MPNIQDVYNELHRLKGNADIPGDLPNAVTIGGNLTVTGTHTQTGATTQTGALTQVGATTNDVLQSAEHGAGAIGTGTIGAPQTYRRTENGVIIKTIKFDITGLGVVGTAAKDAIGLVAGGAAYIGRYVVATDGICFRIELFCIEVPGEGTATITQDIDIGAEDSAATIYDGAVDDIIVNSAALVAGEQVVVDAPALTANDYIYIIEGDTAATTGVYDAGQFILKFYGHPLLT